MRLDLISTEGELLSTFDLECYNLTKLPGRELLADHIVGELARTYEILPYTLKRKDKAIGEG